MRRWLHVLLTVAAGLLILAVLTIGALIGLNAECNGAGCPRSDAWRAGVIAIPLTAAILARRRNVERCFAEVAAARPGRGRRSGRRCALGRRRLRRAWPWHGGAARGGGVRRLACATPLTQRLPFAVAEVVRKGSAHATDAGHRPRSVTSNRATRRRLRHARARSRRRAEHPSSSALRPS